MSYAAISDFTNYYRPSLLIDLATDDGGRVVSVNDPSIAPILQATLDAAAGEINSAAIYAGRYTPAELAALTGDDLAFLVALNCHLAYWKLLVRVGRGDQPTGEVMKALETLEKIKSGERLFNVAADVAASQQTINFPSFQSRQTVNLLRDYAWPAFPLRPQQTPSPD